MAKGPARQWKQDAKELRLQPENAPIQFKDSVYGQLKSSLFAFYNLMGDITMKHQMGLDIDIKNATDLYKVTQSFSALAKAGVEIERWEFEKQRRIEDVSKILLAEFKSFLHDEPELYARLIPIMDRAVEVVKDEYVAKEDTLPAIDIN